MSTLYNASILTITHTHSEMLSFRVVTILSMLFTFANLMPGKKYLIETDDAAGNGQFNYSTKYENNEVTFRC